MSHRSCRAPGGIRCREGPSRLSGLLTRNKLALENVIQAHLSADINCAVIGYTAPGTGGDGRPGCSALRRRYARSVAGPSQEAPFGGIWARQTSGPAASGILNDEAVPGPPGWAGQGQLAGKPASRC